MPEYVNVWGFRRKIKFSTAIVLGIVSLFASYSLLIRFGPRWNTDELLLHENQLKLLRSSNSCLSASKGSLEIKHKELDWHSFVSLGPIRQYNVWWEPFFVNEKHKLLFCHNPQVASANLMRFFIKMSQPDFIRRNQTAMDEIDKLDVHKPSFSNPQLRHLREYPVWRAKQIMETFTKFTFVRNPLDRLVSAWKSKLTKDTGQINQDHGSKIIRLYRKNASHAEINKGYPIKIEEFFQYLAKYPLSTKAYGIHWKPMTEICQFCITPYDFIGRFENIDRDLDVFVRYFALKDDNERRNWAEFPVTLAKPTEKEENMNAFKDKVSTELKRMALTKHKQDYESFGYNLEYDINA